MSWLATLGKVDWIRAHISTFAAGAVLLVCVNLLIGGGDIWATTAIGIWALLLVVHVIISIVARLAMQLMDDDEEEIVLLPIQEAVIVPPRPVHQDAPTPASVTTPAPEGPSVSWRIATDTARLEKTDREPGT